MSTIAAETRQGRLAIAIDAGQTETKIRIDGEGERWDDLRAGIRTNEPVLPQLADVVRAQHAAIARPLAIVALGVSGLTGVESDAAPLLEMLRSLGARRVLLAHDSVTAFLGSLGQGEGAVVAAGTGAVTLAVGRRRVARVDGWGNIMGDAGSAYWIGREALDAAMRDHDGRGEPTALTAVVRAHWSEIEDAYVSLQSDPDRIRIVASFAEAVTELADGDPVSAEISRRAAGELADSVITALRRVEESDDRPTSDSVSVNGGVFSSPVIRARFEQLVVEARPHSRIVDPLGSGLDGAASLVDLDPTHPLHGLISIASIDR